MGINFKTFDSEIYIPLDEKQRLYIEDKKNYFNLLINQISEKRIYDNYLNRIKEKNIMFDLGANIGLFSLYVNKLFKNIYAFEPTPQTFEILKSFLYQFNNVNLINKAVDIVDGVKELYIYEFNSTMNSLLNTEYDRKRVRQFDGMNKISIPVITLNTFCKENNILNIDFIKMDIESEEVVLIMDKSFEEISKIIKNMYIEVHCTFDLNGNDSDKNRLLLEQRLKELGFIVEVVDHVTLFVYKQ